MRRRSWGIRYRERCQIVSSLRQQDLLVPHLQVIKPIHHWRKCSLTSVTSIFLLVPFPVIIQRALCLQSANRVRLSSIHQVLFTPPTNDTVNHQTVARRQHLFKVLTPDLCLYRLYLGNRLSLPHLLSLHHRLQQHPRTGIGILHPRIKRDRISSSIPLTRGRLVTLTAMLPYLSFRNQSCLI